MPCFPKHWFPIHGLTGLLFLACGEAEEKPSCTLTCDFSASSISVTNSCEEEASGGFEVCSFDANSRPTKLAFGNGPTGVTCDRLQWTALGELSAATCWSHDGSASCAFPESREPDRFNDDFAYGCSRPAPSQGECVDELLGDGVCDEASGTGLCEQDAADCSGEEPAQGECNELCAIIAASACPADDTSGCATGCYSNLQDPRPNCRALWKSAYDCGATDEGHTCNDDGRSQIGPTCRQAFDDYAAECAESLPAP
jgi:hypothetical protein